METLQLINPEIIDTCSCGNHLLAAPGDRCEICGLETGGRSMEEESFFDASYFEELEAYLERLQPAA